LLYLTLYADNALEVLPKRLEVLPKQHQGTCDIYTYLPLCFHEEQVTEKNDKENTGVMTSEIARSVTYNN
jgi:hypothetical protein